VQSAIATMTKKYEVALGDKKKEFDELFKRKAMILRSYNEKIKLLKAKGQEIQDLIEKAKTGADRGLLDILRKWEEANIKIFEKYPDGEENELSVLEAVVAEIHKTEHTSVNESIL
jgi:hypothetical protein